MRVHRRSELKIARADPARIVRREVHAQSVVDVEPFGMVALPRSRLQPGTEESLDCTSESLSFEMTVMAGR